MFTICVLCARMFQVQKKSPHIWTRMKSVRWPSNHHHTTGFPVSQILVMSWFGMWPCQCIPSTHHPGSSGQHLTPSRNMFSYLAQTNGFQWTVTFSVFHLQLRYHPLNPIDVVLHQTRGGICHPSVTMQRRSLTWSTKRSPFQLRCSKAAHIFQDFFKRVTQLGLLNVPWKNPTHTTMLPETFTKLLWAKVQVLGSTLEEPQCLASCPCWEMKRNRHHTPDSHLDCAQCEHMNLRPNCSCIDDDGSSQKNIPRQFKLLSLRKLMGSGRDL